MNTCNSVSIPRSVEAGILSTDCIKFHFVYFQRVRELLTIAPVSSGVGKGMNMEIASSISMNEQKVLGSARSVSWLLPLVSYANPVLLCQKTSHLHIPNGYVSPESNIHHEDCSLEAAG